MATATRTNWFSGCATVEQVKARYRALMQEHHPDHGGKTEDAQDINRAMEAWLREGMGRAFRQHQTETGRGFDEDQPILFAKIVAEIMAMSGVGRIEIIGFWVYCFESYEAREALKALGFWFSSKHKAWVYSGRRKIAIRSRLTTNDIRLIHGSKVLREQAAERQEREPVERIG